MPRKKWKFDNIPDQTGKKIIVTGANSGTGFETTKALARKGAHVIMACRNHEKAEKAKNEILIEFPDVSLDIMELDLSILESIKSFVKKFKMKYQHLDVLCNNAGVMLVSKQKTKDGFEMHFGTNHLGHFALTGLLLDLLFQTENSRVVVVGSFAHKFGRMDFKNLQWKKCYTKTFAYTRSKLANQLFAYELQRKLAKAGKQTICLSAHPGWTRTNLQRHSLFYRILNPFFGQHQSMGALPLLYAATSTDISGGEYIGPHRPFGLKGYPKKVKSSRRSYNKEDAKKLWDISEKLTGIKYPL